MGRRKLLKAATRRKLRGWLIRPRLSFQAHRAAIRAQQAAIIQKRQRAEWTIAQNKNGRAGAYMASQGVPTFAEQKAEADARNAVDPWGWAIPEAGPSQPVSVQQSRNGKVFSSNGTRHPKAGQKCSAKTQKGTQCRYHLGDDGKCRINSHNSRR